MFRNAVTSAFIIALAYAASLAVADTKVKIVERIPGTGLTSKGPLPAEITVYVHNKVQRVDYVGYPVKFIGPRKEPAPHRAFITHCDTHVVYELDLNSHEYRKYWLAKFPNPDKLAEAMARDQKENQPTRQVTTVDTSEAKPFYGHTAKHLVTTVIDRGAAPFEETVDGWYLDITDPGCAPEYMRQRHVHVETIENPDSIGISPPHGGFWYNWWLPAGFAVQVTSGSPVGLATEATSVSVQPIERSVVELSDEPHANV